MTPFNINDYTGVKAYEASKKVPAKDVELSYVPATQGEDKYPNDIDFFKTNANFPPVKMMSLSLTKCLAYNVGLILCGSLPPPPDFAAQLALLILHMPLDKSGQYKYPFGMLLTKRDNININTAFDFQWGNLTTIYKIPLDTFLLDRPMNLDDIMTPLPKPGDSTEFAKIDRTLMPGDIEAYSNDWKTCLKALQAPNTLKSHTLAVTDSDARDAILAVALTGMIFFRSKHKDQAQIQQSLLMKFATTVFTFISNPTLVKTGLVVGSSQIAKIYHYMLSQNDVFKAFFPCLLIYNLATTRKIAPYDRPEYLEMNGRFHAAILNSLSYGSMPLLRVIQTGATSLNMDIMTFIRTMCITQFADTLRNIVDSVNAGACEYPLFPVLDQTGNDFMTKASVVYTPFVRTNSKEESEKFIKGSTWVWAKVTDSDAFNAMRGPKHLTLYCTCAFITAIVDEKSRILNSVHFLRTSKMEKMVCYLLAQSVVSATVLNPKTIAPSDMANDFTKKVAADMETKQMPDFTYDSLEVFLAKRGIEAHVEIGVGGIDLSKMQQPTMGPMRGNRQRGSGRRRPAQRNQYDDVNLEDVEEDNESESQPKPTKSYVPTANQEQQASTSFNQPRNPQEHYPSQESDGSDNDNDVLSDEEGAEEYEEAIRKAAK